MEALETYACSPELATKPNAVAFPPEFRAVPCKPLFFDLAANHIAFPSLRDRVAQRNMIGSVLKSVTGWFGSSSSKS